MTENNTTSRKPKSQINLYTLFSKTRICYVKKIVDSQVNYIPLHSLNEKGIKNTITKR